MFLCVIPIVCKFGDMQHACPRCVRDCCLGAVKLYSLSAEQRSAKKLSIPFQAKHRSRLRPPRARDKILFYLNKVLHLNINWDYLAFPEVLFITCALH